jgi:hypothetical protein
MNRILMSAFFLLASIHCFAWQGTFKQKYTSATNKGTSVTVTWYVTDTDCKMQMDFEGQDIKSTTFFLPDLKGSQLLTYTVGGVTNVKFPDTTKKYFAIPLNIIQQNANLGVSRVNVIKTGETKVIQGMNCEKVLVKTNLNETEMWVSKDFQPQFYKFYSCFRSSFEIMGLYEEKMLGFPVQSVTKDLSGQVISSYDILSIQAQELTSKDFTVPTEYKLVK